MIDYRAPVAEQLFTLTHAAEAARLAHWDEEIALAVLHEAARFVEGEIAPLDPVGDVEHARLDHGRVSLPPRFVSAYRAFREAGWTALEGDEAYGGQGLPEVLSGAINEMLAGACVSLQMIISLGKAAARTIAHHGSDAQKARYLPKLISGEWAATMCLTEPQAGSDLSTTRSMATPQADGSYRISGEKIFISGGDHDLTDNILHLVLARTPDAPPGVKGLSLFLSPAVQDDGERNAVSVLRIEEKMGMHASPTCQMAFDGAHAELIGPLGAGLPCMFVMMNAQRLETAIQGIGLGDVAGQRARRYAAERRQGRSPQGENPAPIHEHADVRRMLLDQMVLTAGSRALVYRTLVELELNTDPALVDFLTPLCKAFASDSGVEAANHAVQIHGGYGYLTEYRVEQVWRDARITCIYEGTNGIQANTLADRLLRTPDNAPAQAFAADIAQAAAIDTPMSAVLNAALEHWHEASAALRARPRGDATNGAYLRLSALLALGAAWARMEAAAEAAPSPARVRAAAAHLRAQLRPECVALAQTINTGEDLAALDDSVFVDD